MSDSQATLLSRALKEILQEVRVDNGYFTDLGLSVHRGFYGHVLDDDTTKYPAVTIHVPVENPRAVQGRGERTSASLDLDFPLVLASQIGDDDAAYDEISNCSADVRRAIFLNRERLTQITNDEAVSIGPTVPDAPFGNATAIADVAITVQITEKYRP